MQIYVNLFAASLREQPSGKLICIIPLLALEYQAAEPQWEFFQLDGERGQQREKAEVDSDVNHVRVITYGGDHKFVPNGNYKVRLKCCSDDEQKTQDRRTETSMTGRVVS